ncbi:CPBP family intramembrane metalloprotease [Salipaludibacillus sp. CUR1]|uniref:CPBP family intramembrane glutamic endopeptidase n=1 Tax=Salipaludibacillus sp. CUR1 TaxID=2820003 RepID=UPI001E4077D2|nr:type II CAAX endopeptidase family protein [Salipaludibacillus sp. CUR1]MCE7792952.1 CPBP family intramembrane metalloprotease [Salipaludibacillus sp. CUR1]
MYNKSKQTHNLWWSWKEVSLLLIVTFIFVPVFIEYMLHGILYSVFQDSLYSGTLTGFVMAGVFMLALYLVALRPQRLSWKAVGIRPFHSGYWKWIGIWTLLLIGASVIVLFMMERFNIGWENEKTEALHANMTWISFLFAFVSAAIISPVYEEIFYRGFLYKWFRSKWGGAAGIVSSSTIFTLVHIPTYNTLPVNFISGIIFAWTYEKTNSVFPAMIIHGIFNGLAVILTALA